MYAIINKQTKKFLSGTDYRHVPYTQITDTERMETYGDMLTALVDFRKRRCGKDYQIVRVKVEVCPFSKQDAEELRKCQRWLDE